MNLSPLYSLSQNLRVWTKYRQVYYQNITQMFLLQVLIVISFLPEISRARFTHYIEISILGSHQNFHWALLRASQGFPTSFLQLFQKYPANNFQGSKSHDQMIVLFPDTKVFCYSDFLSCDQSNLKKENGLLTHNFWDFSSWSIDFIVFRHVAEESYLLHVQQQEKRQSPSWWSFCLFHCFTSDPAFWMVW